MAPLINLLPWRARQRQRRLTQWGGYTLLTMLLVIVLAVGWQRLLARQVHLLQAQVSSLLLQQQALGVVLMREQEKQKAHQHQREKQRAEAASKAAILRWEGVLNTLAARLPAGSWLHRFSWEEKKVTLQGTAGNARELAALRSLLRAIPGAFSVQTGALREEAGKGFSFTFILVPEGG